MITDAQTDAELRAMFRTVLLVRQVAAMVAVLAFGALAAVVDGEPWLRDFVVMLAIFTAFGFAMLAAVRVLSIRTVLTVTVAVDIALAAFTIARTPYAPELGVAFIAIIAAAAMVMSARAAVLVTIEAIGLGVAFVWLFGDEDDVLPMLVSMMMLGVVAIVIIGSRNQERAVRRLLQRSERQLNRAERVAHMGSWQWCPDTGELVWSRNMYRLLGHDPDGPSIDFSRWTSGLPPERAAEMMRHAQRTLETGVDYVFDSHQELPSGERRTIQARGSRVVDGEGTTWLVGTAQDVTDLRRVDALKDEFVATASHELRTPATIVLGSARTLDDRWDDLDEPTRRRLITELRRGGERMSHLIEDVLSVARIEHGGLRVDAVEVDLRASIAEAVEALGDARVEANFAPDVNGAVAMADPARVRQVLFNLVENALRYDPSGGDVRVSLERYAPEGARPDRQLVVRVRDHGPGIATEDRERVFHRFVRGTGSTSERGTGLGLYVAKSLVERQGGVLWIEDPSDGGDGVCFCFTVPRA